MRIAAYQARLKSAEVGETVGIIEEQVAACEHAGIEILCCPEAILGGLADHATQPKAIAIHVADGSLQRLLAPLESPRVTTIVGFTELGDNGRLYNSATVFSKGRVAGVYRKLYPAIRRSVYSPGFELPLFETAGVRFGIVICRDSTFEKPAKRLAALGAQILFIPTNNGLPPARACSGIVSEAREFDIQRALECNIYVVRADVAGQDNGLVSYGSSAIVAPTGAVLKKATPLQEDLLVAEINLR